MSNWNSDILPLLKSSNDCTKVLLTIEKQVENLCQTCKNKAIKKPHLQTTKVGFLPKYRVISHSLLILQH